MAGNSPEQLELTAFLQTELLKDFQRLLKSSEMTPTDRATLARLLMQNGWSLDPAKLPKGIRDLLSDQSDPRLILDDDPDVVGKIA